MTTRQPLAYVGQPVVDPDAREPDLDALSHSTPTPSLALRILRTIRGTPGGAFRDQLPNLLQSCPTGDVAAVLQELEDCRLITRKPDGKLILSARAYRVIRS